MAPQSHSRDTGLEQLLTLSETAGRLLQDRRLDVQRLEAIEEQLNSVATGIHRLLLQSEQGKLEHDETGVSRGEVLDVLETIGQYLHRLDARLAEARSAGRASASARDEITVFQEAVDQLLSSIAALDRRTVERLDERLSAFETRVDDRLDVQRLADTVSEQVVQRLPEPIEPEPLIADKLARLVEEQAHAFERLDARIDALAASPPSMSETPHVVSGIEDVRAEISEIKRLLSDAVNPDRADLAGLPDVSEAQKAGIQRVQTGFQLLLRDLTEQSETLRQTIAGLDAKAPTEAQASTAEPQPQPANPVPILEKLDLVLQRLDERPGPLPVLGFERGTGGDAIHASERDSLQRVVVGFRLLLRGLTQDAAKLSEAVGRLEEGAQPGVQSASDAGDVVDRLSTIADALGEQVVAIAPTVDRAVQSCLPEPAASPSEARFDGLTSVVDPLNQLVAELSGTLGALQQESGASLDAELAEKLVSRIDEFVSVAVVISQEIGRLKELSSDVG